MIDWDLIYLKNVGGEGKVKMCWFMDEDDRIR